MRWGRGAVRRSGPLAAMALCACASATQEPRQLEGAGGSGESVDALRSDQDARRDGATLSDARAAGDGPLDDAAGPRSPDAVISPEVDAAVPVADAAIAPEVDAWLGSGDPSGGQGGPFPGTQARTASDVDFVVRLPPGYSPDRALPLVGLFHGQGGTAEQITGFFAPTADAGPFATVAITASGEQGGWVGGRDVQRFSLALNDVVSNYNIDLNRLYLWGFSAGAHYVHGIGLDNAASFAAYAVVAGALDQYASNAAPARAARRIPLQVSIGLRDALYGSAAADRAVFTAAGWIDGQTYRLVEFDGGHELREEHPAEAWMFLRGFSLD